MTAPTGRIESLQFGLYSPDAIRRQSVVQVVSHELYDGNVPKRGGLFDTRMGVLDSNSVCPTDHRGQLDGPGYFGHIELCKPVLAYQYIRWIVKTLRCVCPMCSYPRFNTADPDVRRHLLGAQHEIRLKRALGLSEKKNRKNCERCGNLLPRTMRKDKSMFHCVRALYTIDGGEKSILLQPETIERIFKGITDDDCRFLGLDPVCSRPEWTIFRAIPVPPPSMRPPVRKEGQLPMHDDITFKLCDILKANRALASYIARPTKENDDPDARANAENCYRRVLQYHVAVLTDNTIQGLPQAQQRSGRPLKCIKSRLKSKEGRVRGNLNGKRVDFSARSVITPDPNLAVDELGVPATIARKLSFPQKVTQFNMELLRDVVRRGSENYPGCNKLEVTRKGHKRVYSMSVKALVDSPEKREKHAMGLQVGDIVHRHLIDGDVVLFNRQPSLHRMSMMAHRVRVLPYDTFRLNVNVVTPYNADFDGDEMNMHVPQSVAAVVELAEIASVRRQIISPGTGKPVISLVQDSLLGMDMFLGSQMPITRDIAMDLLAWCPRFRSIVNGRKTIRACDLLMDHAIPFMSSVKKQRPFSSICTNTTTVKKSSFKNQAKKVIQAVFNDMSPDHTGELLDGMCHIAMRWLLGHGFSVGLRDVLVAPELTAKMHKSREHAKKEVLKIITSVHDGTFKNSSSRSNETEFERLILEKLNDSFTGVCNSLTEIPRDNRLMQMIRAGSKGSSFNFSQMVAMIGQQAIAGGRVAYGFTGRTLPHFHRHDDGIRARGFVSSSYVDGLSPTELFFHAIAGREGLIDTAVKSVTRDTMVLLREGNDTPRVVTIGDWIDDHLTCSEERVKHHGPDQANMESLDVDRVRILSNDQHGVMGWHALTAVTRHDPGEYIYRILTKWGREVRVVASKSMLVWDDRAMAFVPRDTDKLTVGDRVPVVFRTPTPDPVISSIEIGSCFPCGKYTHDTNLPLSLDLDEENGFFIGLFLADGNCCGDYIGFAQNHAPTRKRVEDWFNRYDIRHRTTSDGSTTIRGNSTLLVRFLDSFVGKGADGKHVPEVAFAAPESFVRGIIDGYFSGDGHVSSNSIEAGSASRILTIGITRLLARIGIFATLSSVQPKPSSTCNAPKMSHRIRIASRYARRFACTVHLSHTDKQAALNLLAKSKSLEKFAHRYVEKGDTVLDSIASIERMDAQSDPSWRKVYDVTVPDTLNFELFDGLCVRDTAETGYLQRRLVKAMEDVHVAEDGTVRNVKGKIVQVHYGGDGFDVTRLEKYKIPDWYLQNHATDDLAKCIPADQVVLVPFNLERMVHSIVGKNRSKKVVKDNTEVLRTTLTEIKAALANAGVNEIWLRDVHTNISIQAAVESFFDPKQFKRSCPRCKLYDRFATDITQELLQKIRMARAMPGEAVGVVGAQSLGEPATQMSARGDTEVIVIRDGVLQRTQIGPLVDEIIGASHGEVVAPCTGLQCVGVSDREKVRWAAVTHVSRHPANGRMLSVTTQNGRTLDMTASHSFLVRRANRVIPRPGSQLVLGDCLPIVGSLPCARLELPAAPYSLGRSFGRLIGAVLSVGYSNLHKISFSHLNTQWVEEVVGGFARISRLSARINTRALTGYSASGAKYMSTVCFHDNTLAQWMGTHFGQSGQNKAIPAWVLGAPDVFVAALLQAYFDGNGCVTSEHIWCHNNSESLMHMVALCLARFGIPAYIRQETYKTGAMSHSGTIYKLLIPVSSAASFESSVGFTQTEKSSFLRVIVNTPHKDTRKVPGMSGVLESLLACVDDASTRRKISRSCRHSGVTLDTIRRIRAKAYKHGAPAVLLAELDQAYLSDVWWDPIVSIREYEMDEMVYDFTVDSSLQSFMLGNGVFVHNTLNTFHSAGSGAKSNVIRGVPRLKEILGATDNMKARSVVVYPKNNLVMSSERAISRLRNRLTQSRLRDVVLRSEISYEPHGAPDMEFLDVYDLLRDMTDSPAPTNKVASWVLAFTFDSVSLVKHDVTMFDVYTAISAHLSKSFGKDLGDIAISFSDDKGQRDGIAVMRIVYSMKVNKQKGEVDNEDGATKETTKKTHMEDEDVLMVLQKIESELVSKVNIGGVSKIRGGNIRELKLVLLSQKVKHHALSPNSNKDAKQFVIDTVGSNLMALLSHSEIDTTRTVSNDIQEVYDILGIEAARNTIINEFNEVVESAKTYVNSHHVELLADTMTRPGYIVSVNRFGINKSPDYSITNRASFEKTPDTFLEAAMFGKKDSMKGVSGRVMFGQSIKLGTGMVQVVAPSNNNSTQSSTNVPSFQYDPFAWGDNIGMPY